MKHRKLATLACRTIDEDAKRVLYLPPAGVVIPPLV